MFLFISKPDFSCNPHALWKYITENTDCETAWLVTDKKRRDMLIERGIRCELYDTMRGNELVKEAKYVVSNVYVFHALEKKMGQVFINLWHGSGVKAHDFYDPNLPMQQINKVLDFSDKTDLLCVHSLDDRFRLSAQLHFDMRKAIVTGQPRLDCVRTAKGAKNLSILLGKEIEKYDKFIFFVPSFRANSSCHSGKFYSENVFRLDDFDKDEFRRFLEDNNIAFIYKLHPVEQTALKGVEFEMNSHCYMLTDEMLFEKDIRYNEFLNAFDIMISDYSSIAYDYLMLDRPIVYLIPDYDEYKKSKGFVFHNIEFYMPGAKARNFKELLTTLKNSIESPELYASQRKLVIEQRFDYMDDKASERCYQAIMNYERPLESILKIQDKQLLPSSAELIKKYVPNNISVIDSTKTIEKDVLNERDNFLYITEEIPNEDRTVSKRSSTDILDLSVYFKIKDMPNVKVGYVSGGVEWNRYQGVPHSEENKRKKIGFAGTIDSRIYFAMVQYICEAFPECDICFYGDILGEYPAWLDGFDNLKYMGQITYEELPEIINGFDIAILPLFGKHQERVPKELFQYLAAGKQVITSNIENMPSCRAIYKSKSVADAVTNVRQALKNVSNKEIRNDAKQISKFYDWKLIAQKLIEEM